MPLHRLRLIATILVFVVIAALAPTSPAAAQTLARDAAMESGFLANLNAQRASRGVAPLTLNASMSNAAASWTTQMVNGSFLAHASDIVTGTPGGWSKVGENVGRGKTVSSLTTAFMNSPGHARNVLDPDYTHVGIAVVVHPTGRVYTTHRFAALPGAAPAPVAPPAPAATVPPAPTSVAPTPIPPPPPTPVAPTSVPEPTTTPVPPTPVPPTPVPATPVPEPTATPLPEPTPVPPTPTPTSTPTATATPEAEVPQDPSPSPAPSTEFDLGDAPERLAFVDPVAARGVRVLPIGAAPERVDALARTKATLKQRLLLRSAIIE